MKIELILHLTGVDIMYQKLAQLLVQAFGRFLKFITAILRLRILHAEH